MSSHFKINDDGKLVKISLLSPGAFHTIMFYVDGWFLGSFPMVNAFTLDKRKLSVGNHTLTVIGIDFDNVIKTTHFAVNNNPHNIYNRERDFKAGDILVSSDNLHLKDGYLGHSAIVVEDGHIVESPGGHPAIQKAPIQDFMEKHPVHAQFRPKIPELGNKAAKYASDFLERYQSNIEKGIDKPKFSYNLASDLKDTSETIYCSKLVWVSYYYGADYEFENNLLWFAPEDLYHSLLTSDQFRKIYSHSDIKFKINL